MLFCLLFLSKSALSQSVNPANGKLDYSIPIWTIQSHDISFPIVLSYNSDALKLGQSASSMGLGWTISNEAFISRVVKGLPDDLNSANRKGWLYGKAPEVQAFVTNADENYTIPSDEFIDYNNLDAFGSFDENAVLYDTEPDIFFLNLPGNGDYFVFNSNGEILSGRDNLLSYEYENDSSSSSITKFTITTNEGITYEFGLSSISKIKAAKVVVHENGELSKVNFQKLDYYHYTKDTVEYPSKWYLTKISSRQGGLVNFNYEELSTRNGDINFHVTTWASQIADTVYVNTINSAEEVVKIPQYVMTYKEARPQLVRSITSEAYEIQFLNGQKAIPDQFYYGYKNWDSVKKTKLPLDLRQPLINAIRVYQHTALSDNYISSTTQFSDNKRKLLSHVLFNYKFYKSVDSLLLEEEARAWYPFLLSMTQGIGTNYNRPTIFNYYNVDHTNEHIDLPSRSSSKKDIYGYYNRTASYEEFPEVYIYPDLDDNNKYRYTPIPSYSGRVYKLDGRTNTSNLRSLLSGVLKSIELPLGGINSFQYEKNDYYDSITGRNEYGGGLRVKQTRTYDGIDHNNDLVVNYHYSSANGQSSGKLLSKPQLAIHAGFYLDPGDTLLKTHKEMNQWSEEKYWKRTALRSDRDQSNDFLNFSGVMYTTVSKSQNGKGKIVYEYDVPIDYNSTQSTHWQGTRSKIARESLNSGDYEALTKVMHYNTYPMASNTTKNYLNGMLKRTSMLNEAGDTLTSNTTEYKYDFPFKIIKGLKRELLPTIKTNGSPKNMYVYAPYTLRLGAGALPVSQDSKSFEYENSVKKVAITTSRSIYDSLHYPVFRSSITTDSEGTEYRSDYLYNQDYPIVNDSTNEFILALKKMDLLGMKMIPIEVVSRMKKPGQNSLVTSASISRYKFLIGNKLVSDGQEVLRIGNPISDYAPLSINAGNGVETIDSRLIRNFKVLSTDKWQNVTSLEGRNNTFSTTFYDYAGQIPIIEFNGASESEVAFANFEQFKTNANPIIMGFNYPSQNSAQGDGRGGGKAFTFQSGSTINASISKRTELDSYLVSFWYKHTSSAVITFTVDDTSTSLTSTLSLDAASDWSYAEKIINVNSLNDDLTCTITSNVNGLMLDDVILAPVASSHTYSNFDELMRKVIETGDNGISTYYEYDDLNRPTIIRNHKKNILKRNIYSIGTYKSNISPAILFDGNAVVATPETFEILNVPDPLGYSFYWKVVTYDSSDLVMPASEVGYGITSMNALSVELILPKLVEGNQIHVVYLKSTSPQSIDYFTSIIIDRRMLKVEDISLSMCFDGPLLLDRCSAKIDGPNIGNCDIAGGGDIRFKLDATGGIGSDDVYKWYLNENITRRDEFSNRLVADSTSIFEFNRTMHNNDIYVIGSASGSGGGNDEKIIFIDFYESTPNCAIE